MNMDKLKKVLSGQDEEESNIMTDVSGILEDIIKLFIGYWA